MNNLRHILDLLFRPKVFVENFLRDAEIPETDMETHREDFAKRTAKKRKGMLSEFIAVVAIVSLGYAVALLANHWLTISAPGITFIRLVSLAIVAWAVLSRLGYETETFKGVSLLERTSLATFKFFYLSGLLLAVASIFLIPHLINSVDQFAAAQSTEEFSMDVLALFLGILGGGIGYLAVNFWMNPLLRYLEIKHQVTSDLVFYANVIDAQGLNEEMQARRRERQEQNRKHAAEIRASYYRLPCWYRRYLKKYTTEDPICASRMLIGLSNSSEVASGEHFIPKLRKCLRIPDSFEE